MDNLIFFIRIFFVVPIPHIFHNETNENIEKFERFFFEFSVVFSPITTTTNATVTLDVRFFDIIYGYWCLYNSNDDDK